MKILEHEGRRYFSGWAGLDLYFDERHPDAGGKAAVILLHGYAEHSGRYSGVADRLVSSGYSVYYYDQRGHGRSEGVRADVVRFTDLVRDLRTFIGYAREQNAEKKIFLLAHSTGAAASVLYLAGADVAADGLITSGLYILDAGEYDRWKINLSKFLVHLAPLVPAQELDPVRIAEDPGVVEAYRKDPLVYHGGVRVRMGTHFIKMESYLSAALPVVSVPLLLFHGENDRLASPESSRMLYEQAASTDKTFTMVENVGHEVLHDHGWQDRCGSIVAWLDGRI